mmetsp:Transcript_64684/g.115070  ORF Transcript_64684/g.115070 Transcript_64684/m.115070 type:complete len:365 (+) Transcript_64684:350-1444(+)
MEEPESLVIGNCCRVLIIHLLILRLCAGASLAAPSSAIVSSTSADCVRRDGGSWLVLRQGCVQLILPGHLDVAASTTSGAIIVLVVLSIARANEHVVAVGGGAEGGPCEGDGGDDDAHNERVLGGVPGAWVALEGGVGGDGRVAEVGGVEEDNASREQATPNGALHAHAGVKDGADEGGGKVENVHGTQRESCEHGNNATNAQDNAANSQDSIAHTPAVATHVSFVTIRLQLLVIVIGTAHKELVQVKGKVDDDEELQEDKEDAANSGDVGVHLEEAIGDEESTGSEGNESNNLAHPQARVEAAPQSHKNGGQHKEGKGCKAHSICAKEREASVKLRGVTFTARVEGVKVSVNVRAHEAHKDAH